MRRHEIIEMKLYRRKIEANLSKLGLHLRSSSRPSLFHRHRRRCFYTGIVVGYRKHDRISGLFVFHELQNTGGGLDLIIDDVGDASLLIHKGVKAEEEFAKTGKVPDPSSTDNVVFQIVLEYYQGRKVKQLVGYCRQTLKGLNRGAYPGIHHLEEIHVTLAHLKKKRTRLQTYTNISQEFLLSEYCDAVSTHTKKASKDLKTALCNRNAKESWALLEDRALYDNESWNDPKDFAKMVKAISLPQDVPSTSDSRLIELENQVQRLINSHLAPKQPVQAITDRITGALPSDTVKSPKLNVNFTYPVLSARSYLTEDSQCSPRIHSLINAVIICPKHLDESQDKPEEKEQEEKENPEHINTNPYSPPDPSVSFITKNDVMFIEIIKNNYDSREEEPEVDDNAEGGELEEMFDDDRGLESKVLSPLGEELSLFDRPNEVERCRILEAHHLESILQQKISQRMTLSHHD
nr:S-adenosyl-L-homocysteine hydrolase [Tanacetum cinerariifolium]